MQAPDGRRLYYGYLDSSLPYYITSDQLEPYINKLIESKKSRSFLLSVGDVCLPVVEHSGLVAVVSVDDKGPIALAWLSKYQPPSKVAISSLEILNGLMSGRIGPADIPAVAASMRDDKHSDPMKGIVSAYLYDAAGDIANIHRMCIYYKIHNQDVPFDIALLSRLPILRDGAHLYVVVPDVPAADDQSGPDYTWVAMEGQRVGIAGVMPVLRAGWSKLDRASDIGRMLLPLGESLTENPITTFRAEARSTLLQLIS